MNGFRQRIIEAVFVALLTALVTGVAGYYIALPVLETRLDAVKEILSKVQADVARINQEMKYDRETVAQLRERIATTEADIRNLRRSK